MARLPGITPEHNWPTLTFLLNDPEHTYVFKMRLFVVTFAVKKSALGAQHSGVAQVSDLVVYLESFSNSQQVRQVLVQYV